MDYKFFKDFNRFLLVLFEFLFLFVLMSGSGFSFVPDFEFTTTSYPGGSVDIEGRVSSGSVIDFYINDEYISRYDIYGDEVRIYLQGSIGDVLNVPIGTNVVFINNDSSRIYKLNISGDDGVYAELSYGEELNFRTFVEGDVLLKDEEEGVSKIISVENTLVDFKFEGMESYLEDGINHLKFVISPIHSGDFVAFTELRDVEYDKYDVVITANPSTNITRTNGVNVSGFISDPDNYLYYTLNLDDIGNIGAMNELELNGNYFNFTINDLHEGENVVDIISVDKSNTNLFTGEKKFTIVYDSIPPSFDIVSVDYIMNVYNSGSVEMKKTLDDSLYLNSNSISLNISTDATLINYTFNGRNFSVDDIVNGSIIIDLNLVLGQNNLSFFVFDEAGNEYRESHEIFYDNSRPDFAYGDDGKIDLEPEEVFVDPKIAHFPFQSISGKLNKGDVSVTVFTIPIGAKDSTGASVSCDSYDSLFLREYDSNQVVYGSEYNPEEVQMSLLSLISDKKTFVTDSDGSFGGDLFSGDNVVITLQENDITLTEAISTTNAVNSDNNPSVNDVGSKNQVCFFMQDQYGNYNTRSFTVELDAGNTMWKPAQITTIPNTVYAGEIEQDTDAGGGVRFGVIAKFVYTGQGTVTKINSMRISRGSGADSKYADPKGTEMNYKFDKTTNEMIVYIPIEVRPMNIDPMDYPDSLEFWFEARPIYSVDLTDVPIDNTNPIYFKVVVNIERPLDHTKWLTPETINSIQSFLNKSIDFTKQSIDYMGIASVAGVITCTGAKFYYGAQIGLAKDEETKNELRKKLYQICDRVVCTASPQKCTNFDKLGFVDMSEGKIDLKNGEETSFVSEKGDVLTKVTSFNSNNKPCIVNGKPGVYASVTTESFTEDGGIAGYWKYQESSKKYNPNLCIEANYGGFSEEDFNNAKNKEEYLKGLGSPTQVNLKNIPTVCFTPDAPNFDGTRCNFFFEEEGAAGWDPSDNIIESIRCGCITDTYSHLKNYLKIQEGIYMCLEQAKIGAVEGSYCERLMGQAVCDIATNVIFKTIAQKSTRVGTDGNDPHDSWFENALSGVQEGDKMLNQRYKGTFYSQAGLGTDQIVNKMCLGAISGDWSVLTDNILSSIDKNEVEPIFGPMFPESRLEGYNPLTGELTIRYTLSYGVISGGQAITSKLTFICNPQEKDGEYCPEGGIITSDDPRMESKIKSQTLYVPKGGTKQDTIVVTDTGARWRFNQVQISHTYTLNGETKTKTLEPENIFAKGELFAECYFTAGVLGSGAGFTCENLFGENALMSSYELIDSKTEVLPEPQIFYPDNRVFVNLGFDVRVDDNEQNGFDLVYEAICRGVSEDSKSILIDSVSVDGISNAAGNKLIGLFDIPELGNEKVTETRKYTLDINKLTLFAQGTNGYKLKFVSLDKTKNVQFKIKNVKGFDSKFLTDYEGVVSPSGYIEIDDVSVSVNPTEVSLEIQSEELLNIYLIEKTYNEEGIPFGTDIQKEIQDYTKFDKLQAGTCDLKLRILPYGLGSKIQTPTDFDNYDPLNTEDIITDVKQTDVINKKFTVVATPKEPESIFSLTIADNILYLTNSEIRVSYIYQISNGDSLGERLDFDLSLEGISGMIEASEDLKNSKDIQYLNIIIDDDSIIDRIKTNGYIDGTLNYEVLGHKCDNNKDFEECIKNDNNLEKIPGKSGSIRVRIADGTRDEGLENGDNPTQTQVNNGN